jgi:hypothetical protein
VHEIEEGLFHARGRRPQILHLLKTKAIPAPPKKRTKNNQKKVKSKNSQIAYKQTRHKPKKNSKETAIFQPRSIASKQPQIATTSAPTNSLLFSSSFALGKLRGTVGA